MSTRLTLPIGALSPVAVFRVAGREASNSPMPRAPAGRAVRPMTRRGAARLACAGEPPQPRARTDHGHSA